MMKKMHLSFKTSYVNILFFWRRKSQKGLYLHLFLFTYVILFIPLNSMR